MPSIKSSQWTTQVQPLEQREVASKHPFFEKITRISNEARSRQGEFENLISGCASSQEVKNLKKRMNRRIVREGYPKITPFETIEQVNRYIKGSANGHTCLICGNVYRAVGIHIGRNHGINSVDYLDAYGLPRTFGLACEETKELHREALKKTIESGHWSMMGSPEQAQLARSLKSKFSETSYKNKMTIQRSTKFTDGDFWKVIELIKTEKITATEVFELHPELPKYDSFRRWKSKNINRQSAFLEAVNNLSYKQQAQMNMLGEKFNIEIGILRKKGKTIDQISELTGIDRVSINVRLRKIDPEHKKIVQKK